MKFFSDAENLMPHPQGYASHHNETVPNCMGNESRLSDCPTEDPPTRCDELCAKVNCIPAMTPPVVQGHSSTQTASETTQAVTPSLTSFQRAVIPSLTSSQREVIAASLTSSQRAVIPSLKDSRDQTKVIETPSSTKNESTSTFYNLNKVTITLIGVVTMVMVVAGTVVSVCLIVCRVKKKKSSCHHGSKNDPSTIVTEDNMAYVEPKRAMRMYMEKNPAYSDLPPMEPIYEHLE